MERDGREQRFVFGEDAELYDRARPGYAARSSSTACSGFAGVEGDGLRALEVGAGTGKATVAFASRGLRILALEPSPEMAEVARRNCAGFPRVRIAPASFEEWQVEPTALRTALLGSGVALGRPHGAPRQGGAGPGTRRDAGTDLAPDSMAG